MAEHMKCCLRSSSTFLCVSPVHNMQIHTFGPLTAIIAKNNQLDHRHVDWWSFSVTRSLSSESGK